MARTARKFQWYSAPRRTLAMWAPAECRKERWAWQLWSGTKSQRSCVCRIDLNGYLCFPIKIL